LDIEVDDKSYTLKGESDFLIGYSLMKKLGSKKNLLDPVTQLLLGAELGRVRTEILNEIKIKPFVKSRNIKGGRKILLEPSTNLKVDKKYYYRIGLRGKKISVMCLAFDDCEQKFELLATRPETILEEIARHNRFEKYEMDILHRIDVGIQTARAGIALEKDFFFVQDFDSIFKINRSELPFFVADGDNYSAYIGEYGSGYAGEHITTYSNDTSYTAGDN